MNKKGFTLIELLAVIVVLAILALLAVPKVVTLLERSRVNSFVVEGNEIIKVAKNAYSSKVLAGDESNSVCFTVDELIQNGYLDKDNGDVRGVIVVEIMQGTSNETTYTYLSNKNYYVKKNSTSDTKIKNGDVKRSKGSSLYNGCNATCEVTLGGISIKCGDTEITTLTP